MPPPSSDRRSAYWKRNLRILAVLLSVWFLVSCVGAVLFADALDRIRLGGFGLGFWLGQQGSIYVFVVLIFVYVRRMNRLDREFEVDERSESPGPREEPPR